MAYGKAFYVKSTYLEKPRRAPGLRPRSRHLNAIEPKHGTVFGVAVATSEGASSCVKILQPWRKRIPTPRLN